MLLECIRRLQPWQERDGIPATEQYVQNLLALNNGNRFELWKHFEDNAEKLQSILWDQGKWLLAIQGGVLFLPFTAKLIVPTNCFPLIKTENFILVFLIYLFGIAISAYSVVFQKEMGEHIARNFDRAICARDNGISNLSSLMRISILWHTTIWLLAAFLVAIALLFFQKIS